MKSVGYLESKWLPRKEMVIYVLKVSFQYTFLDYIFFFFFGLHLHKHVWSELPIVSEKAVATHCSPLAWKIPRMEEPGGLPSMGLHRVGHDWSDLATATHCMTDNCCSYLLAQLRRNFFTVWDFFPFTQSCYL